MAWYDEAVFYHIYPLGLCGCKALNDGTPEQHFDMLNEWTDNVRRIGCNAIYIGPLFESVGHGYETTDYKKVDCRLGTNEDFANYVKNCHAKGIRVIVDGVFNHVGREFFAFRDLKEHRENSRYKDWFCNVNFWNNNEYDDHFSYDNWGGYNLLVKLNQRNPEVQEFIYDVIRFWVREFDIDGIRLDAADVLDHDFMRGIRAVCNNLKEEFWLMGEVIHGQYSNWASADKLHSVTNYELHKALYSGHNDHNFFEIAHTVQRSLQINGQLKLYNFVDNHDVARIYSKLNNKDHLFTTYLLEYGLPGVPSIYYGSEFSVEGNKERGSDASLRPALHLKDYVDFYENNRITRLLSALGRIRQSMGVLSYGEYKQLMLTNRQFAFARIWNGTCAIVVANNDENPAEINVEIPVGAGRCTDLLGCVFGDREFRVENGRLWVRLSGCDGTIFLVSDEVPSMPWGQAQEETTECGQEPVAEKEPETAEERSVEAPMEERLRKLMDFALELDKEKGIGRQTYVSDGSRKENDAEHAWHMALMVILLAEYAEEKIDVARTVEMSLIHDVVEIDAGDTFAYDGEGAKSKAERERAAADRLFALLPEDMGARLRGLWEEFEAQSTPEARFANTIDMLQPMMLNNATGGKAWREHQVEASAVLERMERKVRPGSQTLYELGERYVEKNRKDGNLK